MSQQPLTVALTTWRVVRVCVGAGSSWEMTLYVNGVLIARDTNSHDGFNPAATSRLVIGGSGDNARGYTGYIYDLRMYHRVLSAAEMRQVSGSEGKAAQWTTRPVCIASA